MLERTATASGTVELDFAHAFHVRDGRPLRISGVGGSIRIKGENIHAEGGRGNVVIDGDSSVDITKISVRNNEFGSATDDLANIEIDVSTSKCRILAVESIRAANHKNRSAVHFNDCDDTIIDALQIDGGNRPGHGVRVTGTSRFSGIGLLNVRRCVGTAADGIISRALSLAGDHDFSIGQIIANGNDVLWNHDAIGRIMIGSIMGQCGAGQVMTDWVQTPDMRVLRKADVSFNVNGVRKYGSFIGSVNFDASVTGLKTATLIHDFWRTPEAAEVRFTPAWVGSPPPEVDFIGLDLAHPPTATTITVICHIRTASAGKLTVHAGIG